MIRLNKTSASLTLGGVKIDAIGTDYPGRVRLRLLEEPERERFDLLLETRHHLKSSRIGGRHLRFLAEVDGERVALLVFSGAAPPLKSRGKWIGWSPRQKARRPGLVCNNSRWSDLEKLDIRENWCIKASHLMNGMSRSNIKPLL